MSFSLSEPPADRMLLVLIHRVSSAGRALRRLLADEAAAIGLTDAELLIVWLCAERGVVQGELATAIGVSPALMSGTVERLRQRELIEMQRSTVDRRRQVWRATTGGQQLLEALRPSLSALAEQLGAKISAAERTSARELCDRLTAAAQAIADAAPAQVSGPETKGSRAA
jgi:DNA-binding MarR family transcriptional regulator